MRSIGYEMFDWVEGRSVTRRFCIMARTAPLHETATLHEQRQSQKGFNASQHPETPINIGQKLMD